MSTTKLGSTAGAASSRTPRERWLASCSAVVERDEPTIVQFENRRRSRPSGSDVRMAGSTRPMVPRGHVRIAYRVRSAQSHTASLATVLVRLCAGVAIGFGPQLFVDPDAAMGPGRGRNG